MGETRNNIIEMPTKSHTNSPLTNTPPFAGIERRTKFNLGDAKQQPEHERDLQLRPQEPRHADDQGQAEAPVDRVQPT